MSVLIMTYEARCKHCRFAETIKRKTTCKLKNEIIRLKDKACDKLEL